MAIAAAVAERLKGRQGRPEKGGNISTIEDGQKTRDLAAAKAGLGSGKTPPEGLAQVLEMVLLLDDFEHEKYLDNMGYHNDDFEPKP